MLAFARYYAAIGLPIFPIYEMAGGVCSCGDPACSDRGKHPRPKRGHLAATSDAAQIEQWWGWWPDANIGLHCAAAGTAVVDIDPRNGGGETLAALEQEHGPITSPLTSLTGGGGEHRYFLAPEGLKLPGKLGPGVDLKHHGYVLLPPSNHASGRTLCMG